MNTLGKAAAIVGVTVSAAIGASLIPSSKSAVVPPSPNAPTLANWDQIHPLSNLTPGVADPKLTQAVLSAPGFNTGTYRNVPQSEKNAVYAEYGVTSHKPGEYEIDHFISLELGGSNDIHNLWPEKYDFSWNGFQAGAHTKDRLEDYLGAAVKSGKISLTDAQNAIRSDWVVSYRKYLGDLPKYVPATGKPEGE